ncbi:AraC family transcriptional regulator [Spongiibacter sp. KMU-166]|uniref:AraC family transcriptional regulator n=1 Tax=Spongiibacter thalassae TaxID=2721624 RepID=A0ABX1GK20_9GAMM|nr:AraC family transcriptional regulator ligand-binding domain-containing protein [Spongiibacter thalassae]NKI18702.1 AraC family transcriptional regulator [Spongiibacter thalassae]
MESYGLTAEECIKGTGLTLEQAWGRKGGMTLDQEFSLYRNLLNLTGDRHLGLKLGGLYLPQTYGIFGYAMMSARNVSTLMEVSARFFDLSFSHFRMVQSQQGQYLAQRYELRYPIPDDLLQLFSDRDVEAAFTMGHGIGLGRSYIDEVHLCYRDEDNISVYEQHFGCRVRMGQSHNAFLLPVSCVMSELPWNNE